MRRSWAATIVADWIACMGDMPPSTMSSNSRALSPCSDTPESVPKAIFTPAATARANVAWICGPIFAAFGRTTAGK